MKEKQITQTVNENNALTLREKEVLKKYRQLSEENKLTIDILIDRLLNHKEGEC